MGLDGGRGAPFGVVDMSGLACMLLLSRGLVPMGGKPMVKGPLSRTCVLAAVKMGDGIGGRAVTVLESLSERVCLALARDSVWAGVRVIVTTAASPVDM